MAEQKAPKSNAGGTIGMIIGLVGAAAPIITAALDKLPAKTETPGSAEPLVAVPELYTKGFPLTFEQASEKLSSEGFKVIGSKMLPADAKPKYRDCIDNQVIASRPKSKEKVKPGTTVILRYITQEVIDESRRIFTEEERQKNEAKAKKAADRQEKMAKVKETVEKILPHHTREEK